MIIDSKLKPVELFDQRQSQAFDNDATLCILTESLPLKKGVFSLAPIHQIPDDYDAIEGPFHSIPVYHDSGEFEDKGRRFSLVMIFLKK